MYTLDQLSKNLNTMANVVQSLEAEKAMSTQTFINISAQALKIRDHFIKDVGEVF
jgi:ribosome-binding protein aMBF1 (putative translation factor)